MEGFTLKTCSDLVGRLQDLCDGIGRDGRPNPASLDVMEWRDRFITMGVDVPTLEKVKQHFVSRTHSTLGTELLNAFQTALGARIGCGACKTLLLSFNNVDKIDLDDAEDKIYRASLEIPESVCPREPMAQRAWIRGIIEGSTQANTVSRIDDAPQTPTPDYFAGRCVAVTSINPNHARWERQLKCVESWVRYGLPVIVVNTQVEIDGFNLPEEVTVVACEELTTHYDRRTQFVSSLIHVGRETGLPLMLINSDIEIHGSTEILDRALLAADKLTIGVRYNHFASTGIKNASRELSGLDVFLMSPELAESIPEAPFGIGKPAWDYWLPEHFRSAGRKFNWIKEPLFFHERHKLGWTQAEWEVGSEYMKQTYGVRLGYGSNEFRRSLEEWQ